MPGSSRISQQGPPWVPTVCRADPLQTEAAAPSTSNRGGARLLLCPSCSCSPRAEQSRTSLPTPRPEGRGLHVTQFRPLF